MNRTLLVSFSAYEWQILNKQFKNKISIHLSFHDTPIVIFIWYQKNSTLITITFNNILLQKRCKMFLFNLPGYGINELSVPRGWTDFLERRDKLLEALPIFIMGCCSLIWSLQDQENRNFYLSCDYLLNSNFLISITTSISIVVCQNLMLFSQK